MELKVNKPSVRFNGNKAEITFEIDKYYLGELDELSNELTLILKDYKPKRTLTQNAYMWKLINEISKKIGAGVSDIYKNYIREIGVKEYLPIRNQALDRFISNWESNGLGWFCDKLDNAKLSGYTNIVAYYGSSTYNTKEMNSLLDLVIQDCNNLGISTLTPKELALLKNSIDN